MGDMRFIRDMGGSYRCELCPHRCVLADGRSGVCRVRGVRDGLPSLPFYGRLSAIAVDPIEKKPLYHFRPGSSVFSVGFVGCNLRCPFCQNWEISQSTDAAGPSVAPAELIGQAVSSGTGAIAFTYSEPLVHIEYLLDAMALARKAGIAVVLVTNGCILEEPAREVLALCDAANIDLKTWDEDAYRNTLGGDAASVRRFIELAVSSGVHTEATTLVVTGFNDDEAQIRLCADFLSSLSADIPYHLSAYRPEYRYREAPTDPRLIVRFAAAAREKLNYVYVGNIPGEANDTRCPACGAVAVSRRGYLIDLLGLSVDEKGAAHCAACGSPLPIVARTGATAEAR